MPATCVWGIRPRFQGLCPSEGQVAYVLLTSAPVAGRAVLPLPPAAPRLACVKPVASVHPEPGSNSSLLIILSSFFTESLRIRDTNDHTTRLTRWHVRTSLTYCFNLFDSKKPFSDGILCLLRGYLPCVTHSVSKKTFLRLDCKHFKEPLAEAAKKIARLSVEKSRGEIVAKVRPFSGPAKFKGDF